MEAKFNELLKQIKTENDMVELISEMMRQGVWQSTAGDLVMDYIEEVGGESLLDRVYDRAWKVVYY